MQKIGATLNFSSGDLVGHLNCRYLTQLDLKVLNGQMEKPRVWDPVLEALAERGALHEQGFIEHIESGGTPIAVISGVGVDSISVAATSDAMARGEPIIVQGALQAGRWNGRTDVLRRVETPSRFGAWSYEVMDTKLARETKSNTVLQISLYSDLLSETQGVQPAAAFVVTPGTNYMPETYRIADYAAYYRHVRTSLERSVSRAGVGDAYPEPIEHCEICRWRRHCDERRRSDDHMSLVAGISKSQIGELKRHDVTSTAALAELPLPLQWRPDRGAAKSFEKIREQARIQVEGRKKGTVLYETLPPTAGFGLSRLPEPSRGDIYFDFEGDPFVGDGGLEFLFGCVYLGEGDTEHYVGDWASNRQEERAAFERFVDFVTERLKVHPDLHIYHFASYEPAAMKRLMGRYATRENEVDNLLRAGIFVDLFSVVRHGIRASVESYSIKKLEPLYSFIRTVPLEDVGRVLARTQARLEMADAAGVSELDKAVIKGYNRDDCASTRALQSWLEALRTDLIANGAFIDRPAAAPEISTELNEWQRKVVALVARLTEGVPDDVGERSAEQQARWLLAFMLDWHGREKKAVWWEYFRLRELSAADLLHERAGLAEVTFLKQVGGTTKAPVHRYQFALQDTDIRAEDDLRSVGGDKFGRVVAISLDNRTVDIKKRGDSAVFHPEAVFAHNFVDTQVLADSLMRIGEYVADHGMEGEGDHRAARDLLMAVAPRLRGQELQRDGEGVLTAAIRIALNLERSVFPVQGPPGAGKTYTGARMICALAMGGKAVGITANSHKVIRNLLDEVLVAAREQAVSIDCIQKISDKENDLPNLRFTTDNARFLDALHADCQVGGGTAWFWARPDASASVDVLFIDEAAQMSLANVLAVSQAAQSIVLLGDPRQLEQPIQGSHPDGVDVSSLDHILGAHATVPAHRGLFLAETWRLHPLICAFNSELFYDGRLYPRMGLENQTIRSKGSLNGAGLRYLPVMHQGNQSSSREEAEQIRVLVAEILTGGTTWIDRDGVEASVGLEEILIIAPYNAQVFELQERIPGARVGTVDKFQGQEAPIVIYSMTTSSHSDAPRGMEFLYSANRLNVATSRAKCICIVVASLRLFEAECRTPRQMQLVNAFCRYLELATPV